MDKKVVKYFYILIVLLVVVLGIFIYNDYNDFHIDRSYYKLSSDSSYTLVIYRKKGKKQDNSKYRFKIEDTSIANIDEKGVITANKAGKTKIEVCSKKGFNKHTVSLEVIDSIAKEIILDKQDIVLNVDDTKQIIVTVNGDKDVIYSMSYVSSNPDVATVSEDGIITGISEGRTVITITTPNGLTAECYVTVLSKKYPSDNNSVTTSNSNRRSNNNNNNNNNQVVLPEDIAATGIKLDSSELTIKLGTSSKITAVVLPVTATNRTVTWSSNDSSIVSIDSNGNIKANKIGVAVITAKTNNGKIATCKVNVSNNNVEVTGITLARTSANIYIGDTIGIGSTVLPSNATNKSIIWTSSNTSVATVSNGVVRGIKSGTTTITAKTNNGKKATCVVTVGKVPVIKIALNTTSGNLSVGDTLKLSATITPSNATDKSVVWSSSNTSVATVSNGVVTAKGAGTTNITVKSNNGITSVCKVTVSVLDTSNVADTYFLNTMKNSNIKKRYYSNESIIIKTRDNKCVLLDTGNEDSEIKKVIYNKLKELQGSSKVNIDYMIISHLDNDHYGNAKSILSDSNISVKNLIIKKESLKSSVYSNIVNAKTSTTKLIEASTLSEGKKISIGSYNNLYFYNTSDVYKGNKNCGKKDLILKFSADPTDTSKDFIKINNKYVYFNGKDFPNVTIKTSEGASYNKTNGLNRNFYAFYMETDNCRSNANSLGILLESLTTNSNKYIYFANDLENAGYPIFGESGVYGAGSSYYYKRSNYTWTLSNGMFVKSSSTPIVKVPSETNVAKKISSKLGSNKNNIVIYQEAHHGYNNTIDAINLLGLNRENLNSVATISWNPVNSPLFSLSLSNHKVLSKTKKYYVGATDRNGIKCIIKYNGNAACSKD